MLRSAWAHKQQRTLSDRLHADCAKLTKTDTERLKKSTIKRNQVCDNLMGFQLGNRWNMAEQVNEQRLTFFFICEGEWSMCAVVDGGLESPRIYDCCQAGGRDRDSKGQLFPMRCPGSLTHVLWSSSASLASPVFPIMCECVRVCQRKDPWKWRCNWNTSGGEEQTVKLEWDAKLNHFFSLPLSLF